MQTLNKRTYVVTSADLVTAVERNEKTISFWPFMTAMSPRLFDVGKHSRTMDIVNYNIDAKQGKTGVVHETHKGMHAEMAPGDNLDLMNQATLGVMEGFFNELAVEGEAVVDLYDWIRPRLTIASTQAIYGSTNPLRREPRLVDAWWYVSYTTYVSTPDLLKYRDYEGDLTMIILGILPQLLARKGYKGRQRLIKAINEYYSSGDYKSGLGVLKIRHAAGKNNGATQDDIARFETGNMLGVLVNATPTFFWMLVHVYSDPALLSDIRAEIEVQMKTEAVSENGKSKHEIDITTLQETCPLLLSAYRELLRIRTQASSSRWIVKDTVLNDQYLLKKDSVLLIPGGLIHSSSIWGPHAKDYDPRRFLKNDPAADRKGEGHAKVPAGAYRAWGGGQTLCPGRFFATTEITSGVAMFVMRFDMHPVQGKWVMPKPDGNHIASSIQPPSKDIKVRIAERDVYQGDLWGFKFADSVTAEVGG